MRLSKNLFFMTAAATTIFVITVLAMVAMLVGNPDAPANIWFNKHGGTVLTVEILLIGLFGMTAMIVDRRETIQEARERSQTTSADSDESHNKKPPQP